MPIRFPDEQDAGAGSGGSGKYLRLNKLKDAPGKQVRGRFLDDFIGGQEGWSTDSKPFRGTDEEDLAMKMKDAGAVLRVEKDKKNPKPFRAAPFANVTEGKVQLWCGTQLSVYWAVKSLARNKEWGADGDYDVVITYVEKDGKVSYEVTPCKPNALPEKLVAEWEALKASWVGPEALYHGGDPFEPFGGK